MPSDVDGGRTTKGKHRQNETGIRKQAMWPTPCAQEDGKSVEAHLAMKQRMKGGPRNTITSLQAEVMHAEEMMIGTPTAAMKHRSPEHSEGRAPNPKELANASPGLKLSAAWVGRLMGYPDSWMDDLPSDPLAPTGKTASPA